MKALKRPLKKVLVASAVVFGVITFNSYSKAQTDNQMMRKVFCVLRGSDDYCKTEAFMQYRRMTDLLLESGGKSANEEIVRISNDLLKNRSIHDAERAEVYGRRCGAQQRLHNYEAAIQDCRMAVQLYPDYGYAYIKLSALYLQQRRYEQAIIEATSSIGRSRSNQDRSDGYQLRGLAKYYSGDRTEALADLDKGLSAGDGNPETYYVRGILLMNLSKIGEACNSWEKAASMGFSSAAKRLESHCR